MQKPTSRFSDLKIPAWSIPLALFALCVLAYGLLIPWLGFAYDEWHFIFYSRINGAKGLIELFNYDGHPQTVWLYLLSFRLLGYSPTAWHAYSLILRWMAVATFWLSLKTLWPRHQTQTFIAAAIFALYPFFTLQFLPISYFEVWFGLFFLFLSFFFSLQALKYPEKFWLWTALAVFAKLFHVATSEYTWFTELMRPAMLWFMLPADLSIKQKIRKSLGLWMPYFVIFSAMSIWRGFFYQPLRTTFRVQTGMIHNPIDFVLGWMSNIVPDSILLLFSSWYRLVDPLNFDLSSRLNLLFIGLAGLIAGLIVFYLSRISAPAENLDRKLNWPGQATIIGLFSLLFGSLPFYIAGYTAYMTEQPINSRIALGALPGAALIITALLEKLIESNKIRFIVYGLLIGLLVGWHVRYENDYRRVWEAKTDFYRQLTWRIPGLQPNTLIVSTASFLPQIATNSPAQLAITPDFDIALAINTIYSGQPDANGQIPYWYNATPEILTTPKDINPPATITADHATLHFSGDMAHVVALYFNPQEGECLQVLGPDYSGYKKLPPEVLLAAGYSHPENILFEQKSDSNLLDTILGAKQKQSWCYFYEKASLAAQKQDWQTAISLWQTADQHNLHPTNGFEYLPFIRAYLHTSAWQAAFQLTQTANRASQGMPNVLCPIWDEIKFTTPDSAEKSQSLANARDKIGCQP